MSDKRYPTRMHEVLGVEPGEPFKIIGSQCIDDFCISIEGRLQHADNPGLACCRSDLEYAINNGIIRRPRLTEEAQEKEDHIIRLKKMRSQKDQLAKGKHAHWLKTPADHAKERDALDAALEALTGKPRLTEEQVDELKAAVKLGLFWLAKDENGTVSYYRDEPYRKSGGCQWFYGSSIQSLRPSQRSDVASLVSWSDPASLDIVQVLRQNGVEVEVE